MREISGTSRERAIRFDLCLDCTMPRKDRHHEPGYRMERTPYDIPGHKFVEPTEGAK